MAIEIMSKRAGVFNPDELAILRRVFDAACLELHIRTESKEAEGIALTTISVFKSGADNMEALLTAILRIYQNGTNMREIA